MLQTRIRPAALNVAISTATKNVQFVCLMTLITQTSFHFLPHMRCMSQLGNSDTLLKDLLSFPSVKVHSSTVLFCYLRTKLKASLQCLYFPKACQHKSIPHLFNSTDYQSKTQKTMNICLDRVKHKSNYCFIYINSSVKIKNHLIFL